MQQESGILDHSSVSNTFEDADLNSEFHRLELDSLQKQVVDSDRPSKRRKLSAESSLLGDVTATLYSLLGSQKVTDLAGLHQIAELVF